jgi:predicted Ser/Thr protein kinase
MSRRSCTIWLVTPDGTGSVTVGCVAGRESSVTRPSVAPPPSTGTAGERYVLGERLGEGGMGVVYRARDTALERDVAFKLLHDRYLGADHQAQLAREARAMARLSHPNVVAVYDVGEQGGRTFVAMELVRGQPVSRWLETPRAWPEILEVFRGVAAGLAAAHDAGILHRDLKPSNILIGDDGRPRLADFGVAHARQAPPLDPDTPLTATTAGLVGSPAYMSLQQICGEPADERADQFSFCVSLHEALYGARPFDAETIAGMLAAIVRGAAAAPPRPEVPAWLHAVVARGLAANPADRFPSMAALRAALQGPTRERRRASLVAGGAAGALAAIALVSWQLAGSASDARPEPAVAQLELDAAAASVPTLDAVAGDAATPPGELAPDAAAGDPSSVQRLPPPRPSPPLDAATAREHARELYASYRAAAAAKDWATARRHAEAAIPFARGDPEFRVIAATSSCKLGDEPRARTHLGKLPRSASPQRIAVVSVCRRDGIELDDLLTEAEARAVR